MGAFSNSMRAVAVDLMTQLGNPCVLTKVTKGTYDVQIGKSPLIETNYPTFSAPVKEISQHFGANGINTNLTGFSKNKVTVPWVGVEIDTTWRYNGQNIITVQPTETQGDVILYTIEVEES